MSDARRKKRREIKVLSTESTWLQKALFALNKAETAREKWADLREEEDVEFVLPHDDGDLEVDTFREGMENRISELLAEVKELRKVVR